MLKWGTTSLILSLALLTPEARHETPLSVSQVTDSEAEIRTAVLRLSSETWSQSLDIFYKHPEEAAGILVAELRPIKRGRYPDGQHPQVVRMIRALRSLTGLDFRGASTARLSDDETHFLQANRKGEVRFFGTWMSRDCDWVAPRDAQVEIIKKWRAWFAQHGHGYAYVNDLNFDHWYF